MVSADPLGEPDLLPGRLDSFHFWRGSNVGPVSEWSIGSKPSPFLPPEGRPHPARLVLLQTRCKARLEERCEVLGNVVISKNFLRTRKIMVMHSNERGECCLRTLVYRSGSVMTTQLM